MIKKIIACLTICFIITGIISPVFSDASALPQPNWSDPGISEIINISDLTGWMLNGGTYDVSTYTDAESFMNDYYSARTKTRLEGADYQVKSSFGLEQQYYQVGDSAYSHPLDVNRVISSSFRDHSGYGRRLSNEVNDALLSSGNLIDTKIPLLSEIEFANFVGYNHNALNLYSAQFTLQSDDVNPDPNYIDEISYINLVQTVEGNYDCDFLTGKNLINGNSYYSPVGVVPLPNVSFYVYSNNPNFVTSWSTSDIAANGGIISIYIDSINLTVTYNNVLYGDLGFRVPSQPSWGPRYMFKSLTWDSSENGYWVGQFMAIDPLATFQTSGFNSLQAIFDYLKQKFKHVNIYVDGDAWSLVDNSSTGLTPEFPDAVGGEDLPSTTWPVHRPLAPYFITAPGMLQAIQDAIDDDGELDIDDLKPYLTDENGDPVPDPQFDPEPVPIPVPDPINPDVVPGLPVLPAIPPEMPGFNGVSVLAEIINFTNQSLPTSLIVTFWGIVFGIVILGLIKILHK